MHDVTSPSGKPGPDALPAAWEHFAHAADIGVRGIGRTKAEAFEQAALALTAVTTRPELVRPATPVAIACDAPSDEVLLVDWLNELVFEAATRRWVFGAFEVDLDGPRLRARAFGEPLDVARHEPAVEVKGATFTDVRVDRLPDGRWVAQCIVDV